MKRALISIVLAMGLISGSVVTAISPAWADSPHPIWRCEPVNAGNIPYFTVTSYSQCPWGTIFEYSTADLKLHGTIDLYEGKPTGSSTTFVQFLEECLHYATNKAIATAQDEFKKTLWQHFVTFVKSENAKSSGAPSPQELLPEIVEDF